jgi:hypothetical protein
MRSIKILGLCFIASLALSAVVSASASAKNPKWAICETRGLGGQWKDGQCSEGQSNGSHETIELKTTKETRAIRVEANGVQTLSTPGAKTTILCKKLSVKPGAVLIGGEPGMDEETLVYEECEVEGSPTCLINKEKAKVAKITTLLLGSTLGYLTEAQEKEENQSDTVTVFKPKNGSEFVVLELEKETGGSCPLASIEKMALPVKGEVVCENKGGAVHSLSHELTCPKTALKEYWVQNSKQEPEKVTIKKLELATMASSYEGKSTIKLSGTKAFEEQEWWIV